MSDEFFEDEALGKAYDHRLMRRLLTYVRPYRLWLVAALVLLVILSGLQVLGPILIAATIDGPIAEHDLDGVKFFVLIYLAVIAVQFVVQYGEMLITQWVGQKAMRDMRMQVFGHLLRSDVAFFDRNPVGRLLTRVTGDVNALHEMFAPGLVTVFGDIITVLAIVIAMFWLNFKLAAITFIAVPLMFAASMVFRRLARRAYREVRRLVAKLNAYLQESIAGMPIVQGFNRQPRAFGRHQEINAELRGAHFRSISYYAVFFPIVQIISSVSMALIVWYGGGEVLGGALTFGVLAAFIQYAERFYAPIRDLSEKYNIFQAAMASSERVFKILDTPSRIPVIARPHRPDGDFAASVSFDNVNFAYNGDDWVLRDVSFAVEPGETLALVGATGAGKTSIAHLLIRFYDYQKGDIVIGGRSIRDWDPIALRRRIGIVSQDVFLFAGNVNRNVSLGASRITDADVTDAMARIGIASIADRAVDDGLGGNGDRTERTVGERGAGLSTGEKQLIAIARAMAIAPDILILDEATSSVDHQTEMRIQDALKKLLKGRTSIVIAHRLSTIRAADRIVVLHKGRVREVGRHDELMAAGGIYADLQRLQSPEGVAAGVMTGSVAAPAEGTT